MKSPHVVTDLPTLRDALATLRAPNRPLGLVPTMGALHEGHLSLVRRSAHQCAVTAVTVFVNAPKTIE